MKRISVIIISSVFLWTSCSKDDENYSSMNLNSTSLKTSNDQVTICHYDEEYGQWKSIMVSVNALKGHLKHGDIEGECSVTPTPIIYDFNECTLDGFNSNGEGSVSITDSGVTGCGVQIVRPASLKTDAQFSYGTYEMDTKASTTVSNQYMRLFVSEDFNTRGIDVGIQPDGTDDEGIDFIVNGVPLLQGRSSDIPVSYPNWYHVKVEVTPDYLKLWLDETLMYELYDYGGITNPIGSWEISSYSTSEFDNLVYTPL